MAFSSKWLDWGKNPETGRDTGADTSVSFVSSLKAEKPLETGKYIKKGGLLSTPQGQNENFSPNIRVQRTDKTDKTPFLDGHRVARIVWQTDKATVFSDPSGRFWRYLRAYRKAWPVIVEGGGR